MSEITVNGTKFIFETETITGINFKDTEYPVSVETLAVIQRILKKLNVSPMEEISSHKTVYNLLKLCSEFDIPSGMFLSSFHNWANHERFNELEDKEYMYLLYCQHESLINWDTHFDSYGKPYDSLREALKLKEVIDDPDNAVNIIKHYLEYPVNSEVEEDRENYEDCFLLDVFNDKYTDYFKYSSPDVKVWKSEPISVVKSSKQGENVITDKKTFFERFHKFNRGYLQTSPNEKLAGEKFPWDVCVVAGGSVTKLLLEHSVTHQKTDTDIFVYGGSNDEDKRKALVRVLSWFDSPNTYYAICGSVISVFIKDCPRVFQVISVKNKSPFDVVNRFDLSFIQTIVNNSTVYATAPAFQAIKTRTARFHNTARLNSNRVIKALYYGFDVEISEEILEMIDITALLENPESDDLQNIIRSFHGQYYPRTNPDFDNEAEEKLSIMSMIENNAKCTKVTDDFEIALGNVVVGGDFDKDYVNNSYTMFNENMIEMQAIGRYQSTVNMRSSKGNISIRSGSCKVLSVNYAEDIGVEIRLQVIDDDFINFISFLQNTVYMRYRYRRTDLPTLDADQALTIRFSSYAIEKQLESNYSLLYNQRNEPLDIKEQIQVDDIVQFVFKTIMHLKGNDKRVELKAQRIIKLMDIVEEPEIENVFEDTEVIETNVKTGDLSYE